MFKGIFKTNDIEKKPAFYAGFGAVLLGALGLLVRDTEKAAPYKKLVSTLSSIITSIGAIAMIFSLDSTLSPEKIENETPSNDEDEVILDDDLNIINPNH